MSSKEKLLWRYSTKEFDPKKNVSDADVQDLLDSLRYSPSSYGLQPWHFLVITDEELKTKLKPHSWDQIQVTTCSHLIVLCAKTNMDDTYIEKYAEHIVQTRGVEPESVDAYKQMMLKGVLGKSDAERQIWMEKQVYIALGFLMSACMEKQIDSCPMEGFVKEEYDKILGLADKGLTSVVVCPVGYRSENDKYAEAGKVRWNESDVITSL